MDDLTGKKLREVLVRKPFSRVCSKGYLNHSVFVSGNEPNDVRDEVLNKIVTQGDFLREYDPSGHAINNPDIYKDIIKYDPEKNTYFRQEVMRCAFAFQRIITTKHIMHLCGNDVQFEIPQDEVDEDTQKIFSDFKKGWIDKNMEIRMYEAIKSYKIVGDVAFIGYMHEGKFYSRIVSYKSGDTIYPHFNSITGKLEVFARRYYDYDENGNTKIEWVEVWDDKYMYTFKTGKTPTEEFVTKIKEIFGMSGYELVEKKEHGFPFIPVAYHRDDNGACWSNSQETIDQYEEAFSQFAENNKAYAFPIMYFKGDDIEIQGDMSGAVKSISMPDDGEAGFLQKQDASEAFNTELNVLYKMILSQSGVVEPPELKSGDLPGVAVKLLYTPAYERAFSDAQEMSQFVDDVCTIFKHGYGKEIGKYTQLAGFEVYAWIMPYIPQNQTEWVTNLATSVQNGFLSKQTASERNSELSKNGEFKRIKKEKEAEKELDFLFEQRKLKADAEEKIRISKSTGKIATGNGTAGRPNRSGREYDQNRNWDGRQNWDQNLKA